MNKIKKVLILMLCFVMTAAFTAFPAEKVQAAAKKKTVYVVSKITYKGKLDGKAYKNTQTISYNKNGLVKQVKKNNRNFIKFSFDKSGQYKTARTENSTKLNYTYDKKGRVSEIDGDYGYDIKYDKKGKIKELSNTTLKFDKKGRIIDSFSMFSGFKYKYDGKGYLKEAGYYEYSDVSPSSYSFTFKNSRPSKITIIDKNSGNKDVGTFQYKKISVPKDQVKTIKKQQLFIYNQFYPLSEIFLPVFSAM